MKITESQLRRIVREEMNKKKNNLNEAIVEWGMLEAVCLLATAAVGYEVTAPMMKAALDWVKGKQSNAAYGKNEDVPPEAR